MSKPLPIGTKVVDRDGFKGTIRNITYHSGSFWYDVALPGGVAVRFADDLTVEGETPIATSIAIRIKENTLTDGSNVYDVEIGGLVLPCVTHDDALALAFKFAAVIGMHTNEEADVIHPTKGVATATGRPGDMAAVYAEENGVSYEQALVSCNMD